MRSVNEILLDDLGYLLRQRGMFVRCLQCELNPANVVSQLREYQNEISAYKDKIQKHRDRETEQNEKISRLKEQIRDLESEKASKPDGK